MSGDLLTDIPRLYTALAEWGACMVYLLVLRPRFSRLKFWAIALAALPVFGGMQWIVGTFPLVLWTGGMALAALCIFAFILLCADVNAKGAVYVGARAFVVAELVASLQWQVRSYFVPQGEEPLQIIEIGSLVVTYGLTLAVIFFLERRKYSPSALLVTDRRSVLGTVAIALVTFFISNLSFVSVNTPFSSSFGFEIFYIRTLVDLAGFVALYAQQGYRLEMQRAVELEATGALLRLQHEQYLQSKRNIDEVNRKYHDLKHYIRAIRAEDSATQRSVYLDQLEGSIRGYANQVQTGNAVLDAVLSAKQDVCVESEITMTCVVDGHLLDFVEPMDLSALVGNAVDNAIESVRDLGDPAQRLIKLAVFRDGAFVLFRIENYHDSDLAFVGGLPVTTKTDAANHGYGMTNMRLIAEKYAGSLTVHADEGWFAVRVMFPAG